MPIDSPSSFSPPDPADALIEEGVRLAQQGQLDLAVSRFRLALQRRPDHPKAYHNLAVALAEKGRLDDALEHMATALRLHPDYLEARVNLGHFLVQARRLDEAVAAFRQALQLQPDHADALLHLGVCLTQSRRPDEAAVYLEHLVRLRPDFVEGHNRLGLALTDLGDLDGAARAFDEALRLDPRCADAHANLGSVRKAQGRLAQAVACYDLALLLGPDSLTTRWNRSLALLQQGDYVRGWAEYESRRRKPNSGIRPFVQPTWDGGPFPGRTLLVHMEQGFGDMLQGIRFVELAKAKGGSVMVTAPTKLMPLLSRCGGIDRLVDERAELPRFDVHAPLLSLPHLLGTTVDTLPGRSPYLLADPALVERWRGPVRSIGGFRVGIAWQGNPLHPWDRHRSMPLAALAPLAEIDGVQLVSLQKGPGVEQLAASRRRFAVAELGEIDEAAGMFMDTAAIVAHLDLVVTVDSSIAHLAGGLGAPAWVALASMTDWRWLHGRDDSPWYPTLHLFQQPNLGDWRHVVAEMAAALKRLVERRV
jgi:Flp pilus assembly protein TadD